MSLPEIRHEPAQNRFVTVVDGHECTCDYVRRGDVVWMTHTGVPSAVGGRGIAAELVRVALAWAAGERLRVEPSCSYVAAYMRRHPETDALLAR